MSLISQFYDLKAVVDGIFFINYITKTKKTILRKKILIKMKSRGINFTIIMVTDKKPAQPPTLLNSNKCISVIP